MGDLHDLRLAKRLLEFVNNFLLNNTLGSRLDPLCLIKKAEKESSTKEYIVR